MLRSSLKSIAVFHALQAKEGLRDFQSGAGWKRIVIGPFHAGTDNRNALSDENC
jgi:hypothetical protein